MSTGVVDYDIVRPLGTFGSSGDLPRKRGRRNHVPEVIAVCGVCRPTLTDTM